MYQNDNNIVSEFETEINMMKTSHEFKEVFDAHSKLQRFKFKF